MILKEKLGIGNLIGFGTFIDDIDLSDWLNEQAKKGKQYFKVTEINNDYFWIENCPYAINREEVWFLKR